jgi:uncharacterized protein YcnI
MARRSLLTAGGIALLAIPPVWAHVTVNPREAAAGALQRYCMRVPSERSLPTIGLEAEFPAGLEVDTVEAPPGWQARAHKGRQGRVVGASWEGGSIPPGNALEFGVMARNPAESASLVWKAIQKYQDGSEVHWVGPAQAQFPAPTTEVRQGSGARPREIACSIEITPSRTH